MSVAVGDAARWRTLPNHRQVAITQDGEDFVASLLPNYEVIFRHDNASALRKLCHSLRIEIVSDTIPDPNNPASW